MNQNTYLTEYVIKAVVLILILWVSAGCTTSVATAQHHRTSASIMPNQVALVPVEVSVIKFGLGSNTEVKEWTDQAEETVNTSLKKYFRDNLGVLPAPIKALDVENKLKIEEYVGLYEATSNAVLISQSSQEAAWDHKQNRFDYTLGSDISFLREHTDADAALFVVGTNYISSGGRKFAFLVAAMVGVAIPLGHSFLHVGLVDTKTGDILWTNSAISQTLNLRDPDNVDSILTTLFESYPK